MKTLREVNTNEEITAPVGAKTTVINMGQLPVGVYQAIDEYETNLIPSFQKDVFLALNELKCHEKRSLQAGKHTIDFGANGYGSVAVIVETSDAQ